MPILPASRFRDLTTLASYVGSFWTDIYEDSASVLGLLYGQAVQQQQIEQRAREFVLLHGRQDGPATETHIHWPFRLNKTDLTRTTAGFSAASPAGLVSFGRMEVISSETGGLSFGLDVSLESEKFVFARDPFVMLESSVLVDSNGTSYLDFDVVAAEFDAGRLQAIWQSSAGIAFESTKNGQAIANAVIDAVTGGPSLGSLIRALALITDSPFAKYRETVEWIGLERGERKVITDKEVYTASASSICQVSVGDTLSPGQALTDAVRLWDVQNGLVPNWLTSLTLGPGNLWSSYSLGFSNSQQSISVQTGVSGFTKISFPLSGDSSDVSAFFTELHTRGVAGGKTLANYLDIRPLASQTSQPTAANLPATVNPLSLLCSYVLQGSTLVIKVDPSKYGSKAAASPTVPQLLALLVPTNVNVFLV